MHLKCYYANLLAWKANGDPRTDDWVCIKKDQKSIKTSSARDLGCTCADPENFQAGRGVHPHIPPTGLVKSQTRR